MKLLSFYCSLGTRLGAKLDDRIVDLNLALAGELARRGEVSPYARADALLPSDMLLFLRSGERAAEQAREVLERTAAGIKAGGNVEGPEREQVVYREADVRLEAPLARPGKLICVMFNYHDALRARGMAVPEEPRIAGKYSNAVTGPFDSVVLPKMARAVRYEAELAVVIGSNCRKVSEERAYEVIAGYTVVNDVSATDLVKKDGQALRGKSFDSFAPMGPYLVTTDEIADPHNLVVRLELNGRLLVDSNTSEMAYRIPQLIAFLSEVFTLEAGDVVATGAPGDLPFLEGEMVYLRPGDVMVTEVDSVGAMRNPVVAAD